MEGLLNGSPKILFFVMNDIVIILVVLLLKDVSLTDSKLCILQKLSYFSFKLFYKVPMAVIYRTNFYNYAYFKIKIHIVSKSQAVTIHTLKMSFRSTKAFAHLRLLSDKFCIVNCCLMILH